MNKFISLFSMVLPWPLRRWVLIRFLGYEIDRTSRIGLSWIYPKKLVLEAGARIGHLTVCKNIDLLHLHEHSIISNINWITGYPSDLKDHFKDQPQRHPELILEAHSAITNRHLIDCTDRIRIGKFSTVAGFYSQLLTHSIDLEKSRQTAQPISIGDYCFVGTNCVLLGDSSLPDYSVLGAKSLLNRNFSDHRFLYGGVPAKPIKELPADYQYFQRTTGYVT